MIFFNQSSLPFEKSAHNFLKNIDHKRILLGFMHCRVLYHSAGIFQQELNRIPRIFQRNVGYANINCMCCIQNSTESFSNKLVIKHNNYHKILPQKQSRVRPWMQPFM